MGQLIQQRSLSSDPDRGVELILSDTVCDVMLFPTFLFFFYMWIYRCTVLTR